MNKPNRRLHDASPRWNTGKVNRQSKGEVPHRFLPDDASPTVTAASIHTQYRISAHHRRQEGKKRAVDVRFGSKADIARHQLNVRFPPEADIAERDWHVRFVPKADSCTTAREILFDQLVGAL
jgi:hypothetical protein